MIQTKLYTTAQVVAILSKRPTWRATCPAIGECVTSGRLYTISVCAYRFLVTISDLFGGGIGGTSVTSDLPISSEWRIIKPKSAKHRVKIGRLEYNKKAHSFDVVNFDSRALDNSKSYKLVAVEES